MTDFIIVGRGLAAITLSHAFYSEGISFKLIGTNELSQSSRVAAGIWNPVVFKRLTKSWLADELIPCLNQFYSDCEKRLQSKLITQRPIIKPFGEEQEKQHWLKKAESTLFPFLETCIHEKDDDGLYNFAIPFGYAKVLQSGSLNLPDYLDLSSAFFTEQLINEIFDYSQLESLKNSVRYKTLEAKNIVFCEGYAVKNNPFFNWIPLKPAKGEVLTIASTEIKLNNAIFNKNGFVMDVTENTFKLGATYAWDDLSEAPTEAAKLELLQKLEQMLQTKYSVTHHQAGIRPSSVDRRPIIGAHPKHKQLFVFNGLGTKGVMLAPYFAEKFVHFCLQKEPLNSEVDLKRFYHLYENKTQS